MENLKQAAEEILAQVCPKMFCSLVATVGEARMRLFPNYFFGNQNPADDPGVHPAMAFIDQVETDTDLTR